MSVIPPTSLTPTSRVIVLGAGAIHALAPLCAVRQIRDVLVVDTDRTRLDAVANFAAQQGYAPEGTPTLGNSLGVRTHFFPPDADPHDALPDYLLQGSSAVLLAPSGAESETQIWKEDEAARDHWARLVSRISLLLRPGTYLRLPSSLVDLTSAALPLVPVAGQSTVPRIYTVPKGYARTGLPVRLAAPVVAGFQRGSKELGVPTANLDPSRVEREVAGLPLGVYYGWGRVAGRDGVRGMVMNVGKRPSIEDADGATSVEVHLLGGVEEEDFYGVECAVVALGYLRPEMEFKGLDALLGQIKADIALAEIMLGEETAKAAYAELLEGG